MPTRARGRIFAIRADAPGPVEQMSGSFHTSTPPGQRLLAAHRQRLESLVEHPLDRPAGPELPADRRAHLRQQAEELYWNELSWEQITADQMGGGSRLVELMFPGLLAFVDGLLLREASPDSSAPAIPRPDAVEDLLDFLARRCVELEDEDEESATVERLITHRLIDLVLYRLHRVSVEGMELDTARLDADESGRDLR